MIHILHYHTPLQMFKIKYSVHINFICKRLLQIKTELKMFCLVELAKLVEMSAQKRMADVSVFY